MKNLTKKITSGFNISKRGKFVFCVFFLSICLFLTEYASGKVVIIFGVSLAVLTLIFLYLILKDDIARKRSALPIFILPFFYTLSFTLFYSLVPSRFLTNLIVTGKQIGRASCRERVCQYV